MERRVFWLGTVAVGMLFLAGDRVAAQATDPPNATGECTARAVITGGETIDAYASSGVYQIPISGEATYVGALPGGGPEVEVAEREIEGEVVIKTPPGLPNIQLTDQWSWSGTATGTYDDGRVDWDLPSMLPRGVPFTVEGYHAENGVTVCEGSVTVEIEGGPFDSPLTPISLGGTALAALGLGLAMLSRGGAA